MSETPLNNFSLISRLFGNLFYRMPTDPLLSGVFDWLAQQGLTQVWALDSDKQSERAISDIQMSLDPTVLEKEYRALFVADETGEAKVPTKISAYGLDEQAFLAFRGARAMPELKSAVDFGLVLLTASWIEDNLDSAEAQAELFEDYLLPFADKFLAKVEHQASLPFYRALALLTREILAAMADELDETLNAKVR